MNAISNLLKTSVLEYCATIGADPLLVQGAGGNVSWKDDDILWVKASGTWLAEAMEKDIFVPLDLPHLLNALDSGNFSVVPRLHGESLFRPSIETLLHALMPQRVVVHLHAIEVLAHLVHDNFQADFQSLLDESTPWAVVDYYKPGAALAAAISAALIQKPMAKVIFLKNHGVVIGGEDVAEVNQILSRLTQALSTRPAYIRHPSHLMSVANLIDQYAPVADLDIHQLALNSDLFKRLSSDWALYPDHVVFLGPRAWVYRTWEALHDEKQMADELPELVFIYGEGVYAKPSFNKAKQVQLRCYYDVMARQNSHSTMSVLTNIQIAELLNWDAEQYRMNLAK
ncbi:MAG: class II aldolase/adducin family protein [Burkholderiaceae bacterium]|nr:class II aldolase/adducin family protein [Burkholderiaceae bacterium]